MSKTSIQATKISQPLAGEQIKNSKGKAIKSPSVCRDGNANPAYHPWEYQSLENFLKGKQIQCGRKSTYHCNLKTVRWIKGYRNTCPIAGCCGTFNRPAPLELTKFNFKQKNIDKKIKIHTLTLSYQHHATGVDVGVGQGSEKKNWTGYFPFVDIILYKNNEKIQTIRHDKKVSLAKNTTVKATFNKEFTFNPQNDNLKIEINYAGNGNGQYKTEATNPAIIYATNLDIQMNYDFIETPKIAQQEATISATQSTNTIITDSRNPNNAAGNANCRTVLTHIIKIQHTTANDVVVTKPNGVNMIKTVNGTTITYKYQDISGVEGKKKIIYSLKSNPQQKIIKTYTAKAYSKPKINIVTKYIKNQSMQSNDIFVNVEGSCWNNIKIYLDGNKKQLANWDYNNINQENFLNQINALSCGWHTLYVYIDNVFYKQVAIQIISPDIRFMSTLSAQYLQSDEPKQITITRTDANELTNPISVSIINTLNQEDEIETISFLPNQSYIYDLDIKRPGTFELKYTYDNGCGEETKSFGKYVVKPIHVQSYDNLLIRSENTPIEYTSIAIRKGDNQQKPITYTNATLVDGMNDFVLYAKDGLCNIGDLGYGILAIKNIRNTVIKNLCIELNPLYLSEDEEEDFDPLITEWKTGMLQNFEDNFFILNPHLKNVVKIFNIQNQDLINEGTENVVLQFSEILPNNNLNQNVLQEGSILEVKIPYSAPYEKEIYMNFLLLGEASDFVDIDNFSSSEEAYQASFDPNLNINQDKYISHSNKFNTRGCLCISLATKDLRPTELYIEGDDLDRNDLTNNDDLDIIYRVKIPESDCDGEMNNIRIKTKIINDYHLVPTGYLIENYNNEIISINSSDDNNISYENSVTGVEVNYGMRFSDMPIPSQDVYLRYRDENNQNKYIRTQTNKDGVARFRYTIPNYQDNSTNLTDDIQTTYRLEEILNTVDIFYQGDNIHKSTSLKQTEANPIAQTSVKLLGFLYYEQNDNTPKFTTPKNRVLNNISTMYIVGQLVDENEIGINDKTITLSSNEYNISQQGITGIKLNRFTTLQNKDGLFRIRIKLPQTSYNIGQIESKIHLHFGGDLFYQESNFDKSTRGANQITTEKIDTDLSYLRDYSVYNRGETIDILVKLFAQEKTFTNTIDVTFPTGAPICEKTIHIFYKSCSEENTKAFNTIFKTNSEVLLPNQIEKNIYCNVKTDLKILAKLQKKVIENHNVNVLTINAINGYKPNKDVIVKATIGADATKDRLGDYLALTAVDIDKEKYSYDQSSDVVYWKIGDMDSYEIQKCNILLEAEQIGHNTIYLCAFDYLNQDIEKDVETSLMIESQNNLEYYVGDVIPIKAILTATNTNQNLYGKIRFYKQLWDENTNQYSDKETESIANISTFGDGYYAQSHIRLTDDSKFKIQAKYEGTKVLSLNYLESESNELEFNNVKKYNTRVVLSSDKDIYKINENISVDAYVLYDTIEDGEVVTKKYFDKDLNIKFFIENQQLNNILYNNQAYNVNFMITYQGEYTIKAFIPTTNKTEESFDTMTITIEGEDNE